MGKMTKKKTARLTILIIILVGAVILVFLNNRPESDGNSARIKRSVGILAGVEGKAYKESFVAGDKDTDNKIVIINLSGEITNSKWGPAHRKGMVDEIMDQLKEAESDKEVMAIVLNINSPGGPVIDADILYEKIKEISKKKVVVALLDRVAASGGYYVASAAHKIVAHPLTLTGSIGVIMDFVNVQELFEKKLGIEMSVIKSGKYKDIGSPYRPMDQNERKMLQGLVDSAHAKFVRIVSEGRNIPMNRMGSIADGRIYSGEQAKDVGLVDELGTQDAAVELAKNVCGIKKAKIVEYSPKPRLRDLLMGKLSENFRMDAMPKLPEPALKYIWRPSPER